MHLTPAQLVTLKASINADPAINGLANNSDTQLYIAQYYAQPFPSAYFVWRDVVTVSEIQANPGFAWAEVDNIAESKARIWVWMTQGGTGGTLSPRQPNVIAGIKEAFVGTAAKLAMRHEILKVCQAQASRGQRLYCTPPTAPSTDNQGVGPAVSALTAPIDPADVEAARSLP